MNLNRSALILRAATLTTAAMLESMVPSAAVAKDKEKFTAGIQISKVLDTMAASNLKCNTHQRKVCT